MAQAETRAAVSLLSLLSPMGPKLLHSVAGDRVLNNFTYRNLEDEQLHNIKRSLVLFLYV